MTPSKKSVGLSALFGLALIVTDRLIPVHTGADGIITFMLVAGFAAGLALGVGLAGKSLRRRTNLSLSLIGAAVVAFVIYFFVVDNAGELFRWIQGFVILIFAMFFNAGLYLAGVSNDSGGG